jgi:hypothetical protein
MINVLGLIIGFFVVHGHSLMNEIATFAATEPRQSDGLCSRYVSFDLELLLQKSSRTASLEANSIHSLQELPFFTASAE